MLDGNFNEFVVLLEVAKQSDAGVAAVNIDRGDLFQRRQIVSGGDDDEGGHVGGVCRIHDYLERLDDDVRLNLEAHPVLTLRPAALPVAGRGLCEPVGPGLAAGHRQGLDAGGPVLQHPAPARAARQLTASLLPGPSRKHGSTSRLGNTVKTVFVVILGVKTVFTEVEVITSFTFEPGA